MIRQALDFIAHRLGSRASAGSAPKPGELVKPAGSDASDLFSGDPTPQRLQSILREAAYGSPARQNALFDTMLETDGHLDSVYNQRRTALTGLDWELVPANQVGKSPRIKKNERLVEEAHAYCLEVLAEMEGWEDGLFHLNDAIGRSTAVVELVWERAEGSSRPVAVVPIDFTRLAGDNQDVSRLRALVDESDYGGILLDEYPPGKFIVHCPRTLGGNRFRGGLLRTATFGYLGKRYGRRWWLKGLELFGLPITIARYSPGAQGPEKTELLKMVRDMGVARGGIFPAGAEIELIEAKSGGGTAWPHERLVSYVDAEYSKEFVGQTLTTEIGETGGARAAAQVHEDVRNDLIEDDARKEGATVRAQLLVPLVQYKFGADAAGVAPYFRRVDEEEKDLKQTGELIALAVNDLGAQIPGSVVEDELGLTLADQKDRDKPLPGRSAGFDPFGDTGTLANRDRTAHALTAHRALDKIVSRKTAISGVLPWLFTAVLASQAHTRNVIAQVASAIERAPSSEAAMKLVADEFQRLPTEDMVELQRQFLLATYLHGQATTLQQIASRRQSNKQAAGAELVAHQDRIDFERIPFVEAIEALRVRNGLDPETFVALDRQARSRAWRVAGVWNMSLLADIHRELLASIDAGETARDFRLRLPDMAERRGWIGENPWHADVVHFQNFVMSHAAGRHREYVEAGIRQWRFVASGESCPICEPFVGKVFAIDDRRVWPPLHFWCDCSDEVVFNEELRPGELAESRRVKSPALDAELSRGAGFKWDVGQYAALEPLELSRFPEALRPAFREMAEAQGWEVIA